ncbi:hypothetical protein XFF6992_370172 [Xanthomonas citri pv. fuscans]|nr:hypothetical protein XFF6992_370172 [Xanthomonas citri pv. fuscans]SOO33896.1 hypothetical protein XFF6994_3280010 [Xanthomonas citri pv. fuscans]
MPGGGGHVLCNELGQARVADLHQPQDHKQRSGRTALPAETIRTACSSVCRCLLTPAISTVATSHRTIPRSSDTFSQVRSADSRSPPGTGHRKLWRNATQPRRQPRLTSNIIQKIYLSAPFIKIENNPFREELNNLRYYIYEDNIRITDIRLHWRLHIIGIRNNATPFADGERSRPQFQDPPYGSARFLEAAHGFAPSMLAFYVLRLVRQSPMHLQPHPACRACFLRQSIRRPCRSRVAASGSTKAVMSRNDAAHNRPVRVGISPLQLRSNGQWNRRIAPTDARIRRAA